MGYSKQVVGVRPGELLAGGQQHFPVEDLLELSLDQPVLSLDQPVLRLDQPVLRLDQPVAVVLTGCLRVVDYLLSN